MNYGKFKLSHAARLLLLRGFFFVLALAALYGVWANRMFVSSPEFLLLAVADITFAVLFLYLAAVLPKRIHSQRRLVLWIVGASWLYIVVGNAVGTTLYSKQLGLASVAANAGYTVPLYIASEILYLIVLPTVAFFVVWQLARRL